MPIQFDKFDQQKVNRLKAHLDSQAEKGSPKFYEIFIDSLKAVQKTDDPKEFEGYEDYMTSETQELKIIIYNSGASPRNDKYVFSMKAKSPQEALEMGLDGTAFKLFNKAELEELKLNRDKQVYELEVVKELKEEIADLQKDLDEKEAYILQLEDGILKAKANGNKLGGVDLGEALMHGFELLIRNNTKYIKKIPSLEGIADMIDEDTNRKQIASTETTPATEVTFHKKPDANQNTQTNSNTPTQQLSDEEKWFLDLFKIMQTNFSEEELADVIEILDVMSKNKHLIEAVLKLVENSNNEAK